MLSTLTIQGDQLVAEEFERQEPQHYKLIFLRDLDTTIWKLWLEREPAEMEANGQAFVVRFQERLYHDKSTVFHNPFWTKLLPKGNMEHYLMNGLPEEIEIKMLMKSGYIWWKRAFIVNTLWKKWSVQQPMFLHRMLKGI